MVAPFIADTGPAAIWPVILGFIMFALVSVPIFEYTRIASFAGGYYGLAELGFGRAAGKFTALTDYSFYITVGAANAFFIPWLVIDTTYILYNVLLPSWSWILMGVITLAITYFMSIRSAKNLGRILLYVTIAMIVIVTGFILYVIAKSPYNSVDFINPATSTSGLHGILLATAIVGFFLFAGYGSALFYSEEAVNAKKTVWKAVFVGLFISMAIIDLSVYSELVSVPRSQYGALVSASIPEITAWVHFIPPIELFGLNMVIMVVSLIVFGAAGGSAARLLWSLARDDFIKSKWLAQLHGTKGVPQRAAGVNFVLCLIMQISVAGAMVFYYGYNANTIATAWFVSGTAATIFWYLHHFIPEFGLYAYLTKHPIPNFSLIRKIVSELVIPIGGAALFGYTFYEGIISDSVEPYFAFVIMCLVVTLAIIAYVAYKYKKGELGKSVISYSVSESIHDSGSGLTQRPAANKDVRLP